MKKYLAIILTLVLALCIFGGCTKTPPTENSTTTATTTHPTTIPNSNDNDISPMMWRVTGENGETMYLFGTIHVGTPKNKDVLNLISKTVESCDALAVEFDTIAYQKDMDAMMSDMAQYIYSDGTKISDHLSKDLYSKAVSIMQEAKLYNSFLDYYNVSLWYQYADQAALTVHSDLVADYGMDSMLLDKAYDDKMEILSVESGSFQMALLNSFSDELYLLLMESLFANIDSYGDSLNELYSAWLTGDFEKLSALVAKEDFTGLTDDQIVLVEDYNYKLMDERNIDMGDKAVQYLESGKTVFFAVGAAHMTGETGLVKRLADEGYTVERVYFTGTN